MLEMLTENRPGWDVTSVDAETYCYLEERLKVLIEDLVHRHPTKGKTFKVRFVALR